jgi:2-C-methyl-D-erythritol 4-phosphate cytidylyltransferase
MDNIDCGDKKADIPESIPAGREAWGGDKHSIYGYTSTGKPRHKPTKQMLEIMAKADPKLFVTKHGVQRTLIAKMLDKSEEQRSTIKQVRKAKTEIVAAMDSDEKPPKEVVKKKKAVEFVAPQNPEVAELKDALASALAELKVARTKTEPKPAPVIPKASVEPPPPTKAQTRAQLPVYRESVACLF